MSTISDLRHENAELRAIIEDLTTTPISEPRAMTAGVDTIDDYMHAIERSQERHSP